MSPIVLSVSTSVALFVHVIVNGSSRRTRESLIDISLLARKHKRAYLHHIAT